MEEPDAPKRVGGSQTGIKLLFFGACGERGARGEADVENSAKEEVSLVCSCMYIEASENEISEKAWAWRALQIMLYMPWKNLHILVHPLHIRYKPRQPHAPQTTSLHLFPT